MLRLSACSIRVRRATANLRAIAKQANIIEKAVAELKRLLSDDSNESEEAPVEKQAYTGKPRGRKPKAESQSA
jgi:hypothetical protein